jgi:hypothetical protein
MNTNTANTASETVTADSAQAAESFEMTAPETFSLESPGPETSAERKKLRPVRFATGLCLTTFGMGMVLFVGIRMLEVQQIGGDFALLVVAGPGLLCVLTAGLSTGCWAAASAADGILLFCLQRLPAGRQVSSDEQEFDRLADFRMDDCCGNISFTRLASSAK